MLNKIKIYILKGMARYYGTMENYCYKKLGECNDNDLKNARKWDGLKNKYLYKQCNTIVEIIGLSPVY